MSSLWTPSGEHRVAREPEGGPPQPPGPGPGGNEGALEDTTDDTNEAAAQVEALREQLARTPAEEVVANHCYGLFELAAIYLSVTPPRLDGARLAVDALGAIVDTVGDRLGEARGPMRDALAQIRLAYVQVEAAGRAAEAATGTPDGQGG